MPDTDWRQYNVEFPDRITAERVAAQNLRPALVSAQRTGQIHGWWFIRKRPWKLRYLSPDPEYSPLTEPLDQLARDGRIVGWTIGVYEPETTAFGGQSAMDLAHELFHHDSHYVLDRTARLGTSNVWRRELAVLLCSAMMRAAGLDWYEQGDVWEKVAEMRPAESAALQDASTAGLIQAMRRLMTVDARRLRSPARAGPLTGWIIAFEQAGQSLAALARYGRLTRGLRAVLAHHIIFHANRAGLPVQEQAILAALASHTVFKAGGDAVSPPVTAHTTTRIDQVPTLSDDRSASAERLRAELTDRLRDQKILHTPAIEAAFRQTPRHLFLPGVPVDQAYADSPVYIKHDPAGASISAASQPWMVASMLEQLDPRPGERIMEAGAGTGYNAAIMGAVVGETGRVTTIDVDEDLVTGAREHLAAAGVTNVDVILGDGALGHPEGAPYDRIIATVGAFETPTPWLEQLAPGGRLVVPLRLRGTVSRSIVFERGKNGWRSRDSRLAVFMPLRGIADDARRYLALTPQQDVVLQVHKDQDTDGQTLAGVLDSQRHEIWTGVLFPPNVPYEWLELWLSLRLDNALMRMNVQPTAAERGQVNPMFPWGSMATTRGADLAYLTTRLASSSANGEKLYEVGVVGHGPGGMGLTQAVAAQVRLWDREYRARSVCFELSDMPATADPAIGRFVLDRPHHPITVIWE